MKKRDYESWLRNPETQAVLDILRAEITDLRERLTEGYIDPSASMEELGRDFLKTHSRLNGLNYIFNLPIEDEEDDL